MSELHPLTDKLQNYIIKHFGGYGAGINKVDQIIREYLQEKTDLIKDNFVNHGFTAKTPHEILDLTPEETLEKKFTVELNSSCYDDKDKAKKLANIARKHFEQNLSYKELR